MTLRQSMLDKCPITPFSVVVRTIFEELGAPPSELFAEFDEEPIASASLAQVLFDITMPTKQALVQLSCPKGLESLFSPVREMGNNRNLPLSEGSGS